MRVQDETPYCTLQTAIKPNQVTPTNLLPKISSCILALLAISQQSMKTYISTSSWFLIQRIVVATNDDLMMIAETEVSLVQWWKTGLLRP